jgi:hypothetical protein
MSTRQNYAGTGRLPEGLIYPELMHSGISETLTQNANAFNTASRGAIRLVPNRKQGDFAQETFFKNVSNLIQRRAVEGSPDNPDVTPLVLPAEEKISVKLNRRIGPVDVTLDAFKKLGREPNMEVVSYGLGEQVAVAQQLEWLNDGLTAAVAGITNQATLTVTRSPEQTLDSNMLIDGLAAFGDAASRIVIWVMHSKVYYDLVKSQFAANIDGVSNFNIASASPVTLNRPVLVTDSTDLLNGSIYTTLGLTAEAVVLEESETPFVHTEIITGKENLVVRMQGEFAYNLGLRGLKWDVTNGGVNPANAAIGTGTNWDSVMDSVKDLPGVAINSL